MAEFFAPGRVNLIGEHTDYAGGLVLPFALPLGVTVDAEPAEELALNCDPRYVEAVAAELGVPPGLRGTVRGTVPMGAGLASSAALEVALARALCSFNRLELSDWELIQATRRAEERAVGVPCGVMDQAAAVLARDGHAILIDTAALTHRYVALPEIDIVVLDSGVRRRLEDSRYAERRAEVERGHPRRLRHVASENRRVEAAVAALERGDLDALGPLFRASHDSLRDDFEVSTPELDALVDEAYANGAVAARMTGAGFGGCIVALARRGEGARLGGMQVFPAP